MGKKGQIPWNKGLSLDDPRVKANTEARNRTMISRYGWLAPSQKGHKHSEESRKKMAMSARNRWQRDRREIIAAQTKGKLTSERFKLTHRGFDWSNPEMRKKILWGLSKAPRKSTKIEILAQESLNKRSIPFLANYAIEDICTPDLIVSDYKIAIFCDGCFWHACRICGYNHPRSRQRYGLDTKFTAILKQKGWKVFRFWEHEFKSSSDIVGITIENFIRGQATLVAIGGNLN